MDKVPPTYVNLTVVWGFYLFEWWGRTLQTWFNESAENSITLCKSQILLWKNNLITPYSSWGCDKHRQFQVYNHAVWMWHITATDHIHILRLVSIIQTQLKRGEIVWVCAWGNSHVINYKKDNILFQFSSTHLRTNRFAGLQGHYIMSWDVVSHKTVKWLHITMMPGQRAGLHTAFNCSNRRTYCKSGIILICWCSLSKDKLWF